MMIMTILATSLIRTHARRLVDAIGTTQNWLVWKGDPLRLEAAMEVSGGNKTSLWLENV